MIGIIHKYACAVIVPPRSLTLTVDPVYLQACVLYMDYYTWAVTRLSAKTQGKTNKHDSGSIYILLCNSLDFLSAFVVLLLRITTHQLILLLCWSTLFKASDEYLSHCRCCIKRLMHYIPHWRAISQKQNSEIQETDKARLDLF